MIFFFASPCEMISFPISFTPKLVICLWKQLVKMTSATTEQKLKNPCMLPQYIYLSSMQPLDGLFYNEEYLCTGATANLQPSKQVLQEKWIFLASNTEI